MIPLPLSQRNLILTGYVEPNQPRIALQVAQRLQMPFIDVEQLIEERVGRDIVSIRENFGERRLKSLELDVMREVALHRNTVIRVSGGILRQSEYLGRFQETGPVVCLVAQLGWILQRMHLAMGAGYHDPAEREIMIAGLKRDWRVRGAAGIYEIDATYMKEEQIVNAVIQLWQEVAIERG